MMFQNNANICQEELDLILCLVKHGTPKKDKNFKISKKKKKKKKKNFKMDDYVHILFILSSDNIVSSIQTTLWVLEVQLWYGHCSSFPERSTISHLPCT